MRSSKKTNPPKHIVLVHLEAVREFLEYSFCKRAPPNDGQPQWDH